MTNEEQIIYAAIIQARKIARQKGFEVGQTILNPDDSLLYLIKAIKGDKIEAELPAQFSPNGKRILKVLSTDEIYDPKLVLELILQAAIGYHVPEGTVFH